MEDLDYQKLLSQLLQIEGPKRGSFDGNGNLIVATSLTSYRSAEYL